MQPGRSCPLHYRYSPQVFTRAADFCADTLYVIGGLYGNVPALEAVLELAARERATLMFNGDFNWFNIDDAAYQAINSAVLRHPALRGNVETEIAGDDSASNGCGCAYPEWVGDAQVAHSNAISGLLRATARRHAGTRAQLAALPMHAVAEVGGTRIAIVHGDLESLAGWSLAQENLVSQEAINVVLNQILMSKCSIVSSSHTCLPAALARDTAAGHCAVFNNGAAGLPNFRDTQYGVITRIATTPAPSRSLYGARIGAVYADALPIEYDHVRWQREFLAQWPPGSSAHLSYHRRIVRGPAFTAGEADRLAVSNTGAQRPTAHARRNL
jgi:predicted phosphodiesterase